MRLPLSSNRVVSGSTRGTLRRGARFCLADEFCFLGEDEALFPEREGFCGAGFGTATPREALDSHRVFAAAVRSQSSGRAEPLD